jgi:hypothetical protein
MDLLQQQEDSTLCADLSAMMYDLALCRSGLDIVCHPESVRVIVNLSNHTHEPTRACCARLLGLVLARGGIDRVIQAGGEQSVCIIGMLAATLTTEVDAVGRARDGVGNLGPMPPESEGSRYGEGSAHDAVIQARSSTVAEPAPIHAVTEAMGMPFTAGAVDAQTSMPSAMPAATVSYAGTYQNVEVVAAALPAEPEPAMSLPPMQAGNQHQPPSYIAPPPQVPPAVVQQPLANPQASSVVVGSVSQQPQVVVSQPPPQAVQAHSTAPPPAQTVPLPLQALPPRAAPMASAQLQPQPTAGHHAPPAAAVPAAPAAPSMQEADATALLQLLEQFKLHDTLAALSEYGVGCVDDLRELEPSEIDGLSVTPIAKKKLHKLMIHLGVTAFLPVFRSCGCECGREEYCECEHAGGNVG